jgi:hypothetical protein
MKSSREPDANGFWIVRVLRVEAHRHCRLAMRCEYKAVQFVRLATLPCFQPQGNALFF